MKKKINNEKLLLYITKELPGNEIKEIENIIKKNSKLKKKLMI